MGTYNWQLFVLCGFGWFADKCVPFLTHQKPREVPLLMKNSPPSLWMQVSKDTSQTVLTEVFSSRSPPSLRQGRC